MRDNAVEEVLVYGEDKVITAEIYPTQEYIDNRAYFDLLIHGINSGQPQYKQISRIKLRSKEFEKNSSKKILRYKVTED